MKKLFPLGSECFTNSKLEVVPQLKEHKFFHSPFNGCRILNGFKPYFPQREFLFNREQFLSDYYDKDKWHIVTDGQDMEAINWNINIRRCHLDRKGGGIEKVISDVKKALENADINNMLYIMNMCDDFKEYYDIKAFQHECHEKGMDNILLLYMDKDAEYVDVDSKNSYVMTGDWLDPAVQNFYQTRYEDMLKLL